MPAPGFRGLPERTQDLPTLRILTARTPRAVQRTVCLSRLTGKTNSADDRSLSRANVRARFASGTGGAGQAS